MNIKTACYDQRIISLNTKLRKLTEQKKNLERRQAAAARKARVRALICMGALMERLLRTDSILLARIIAESGKEAVSNQKAMTYLWPDLVPEQS